MRKLLLVLCLLALPVMAEETIPNQEIDNTKSYTGINYNRQDSEQVGVQKIVNININIVKKGALFQHKDTMVGEQEK